MFCSAPNDHDVGWLCIGMPGVVRYWSFSAVSMFFSFRGCSCFTKIQSVELTADVFVKIYDIMNSELSSLALGF